MSNVRKEKLSAHAVILAGGRGTRFWPRSRIRTPKQLLNIVGERTMLEQTAERLAPLFPLSRLWVVTNKEQAAAVRQQLPRLDSSRILSEPVGRNTAAAIGLAAIHIARHTKDALMAVLPADHFIARAERYRRIVRVALRIAARPGNMVVLGIPPTRPETGYGYVERGRPASKTLGLSVYRVKRFTEKPALAVARRYVTSGRYSWNAGMFFWRVSTYLESLRRFLPATFTALMELAETIGTPRYKRTLRRIYPRLESISVDYALLEPASRASGSACIYVLPAKVGWSDIGSWAAAYELLASKPSANVSAGPLFALDAQGNYFWAPKKLVAAIGIRDLVLIETDDAVLLCSRDRSQDIGQVVKQLEKKKLGRLL